jgi:hypothetical protein
VWQHADPVQHGEPSQQSFPLDAAKEVPRVSIARAIRLNTPVVIFFMTILLD